MAYAHSNPEPEEDEGNLLDHGSSSENHFIGFEERTDEATGCTQCVMYCTCGREWK